jgi:hypothetical protein
LLAGLLAADARICGCDQNSADDDREEDTPDHAQALEFTFAEA